jgi:hypothetical protein
MQKITLSKTRGGLIQIYYKFQFQSENKQDGFIL